MFARRVGRLLFAQVGLCALAIAALPSRPAQSRPLPHPLRRPIPVHRPLPVHLNHGPHKASTPVPSCPGVPVACPMPAPCQAQAKVWKVFYAYPGHSNTVRSLGNFALDAHSDGLNPGDSGSVTLTDDSGAIILQLQSLQFETQGATLAASNDQGSVSVWPFAGQFSYEFKFDTPNLPPGFFRFRYNICMNVGDDGFQQSVVCQQKPFGGFVCHE